MLHVMYQSHAFYTCYVLSRLLSEVKIPFSISQSERPSFFIHFHVVFSFTWYIDNDILIQVGILGYFSNVVTIEICVNLEYVKNGRWRYLKLILPIYVWYHGTMKMCVLVWRTLDVSVMDGRQLLIVALYSVLRQSNPKATPTSPHPFILAEQPHLPVIVIAIVLDIILAIPINKIPPCPLSVSYIFLTLVVSVEFHITFCIQLKSMIFQQADANFPFRKYLVAHLYLFVNVGQIFEWDKRCTNMNTKVETDSHFWSQ